jgi:hypothetical protein
MHPARRGIGHKNVYICQCIRSVASDTAKQWCFKKLQVEAMQTAKQPEDGEISLLIILPSEIPAHLCFRTIF